MTPAPLGPGRGLALPPGSHLSCPPLGSRRDASPSPSRGCSCVGRARAAPRLAGEHSCASRRGAFDGREWRGGQWRGRSAGLRAVWGGGRPARAGHRCWRPLARGLALHHPTAGADTAAPPRCRGQGCVHVWRASGRCWCTGPGPSEVPLPLRVGRKPPRHPTLFKPRGTCWAVVTARQAGVAVSSQGLR